MLSEKQKIFVTEFCTHRNAARAARAAGYAPGSARKSGNRLMTSGYIQAAIAAEELVTRQALNVSRESVIRELQGVIEAAKAQANPMAMIAGWREIAKLCGMYAPERHAVTLSADATGEWALLERMSDAALVALATGHPPC